MASDLVSVRLWIFKCALGLRSENMHWGNCNHGNGFRRTKYLLQARLYPLEKGQNEMCTG